MPAWRQLRWAGQPQFAALLDKGHPACPDLGVWLPTAGRRNGVSGLPATIVNSGVGFVGGRGGVGYTTSGQTLTATNGNGLDTGFTTLPSQLTLICQFISYDAPSSAAAFGGPVLKDQYGINWHHSNAAYRGAFVVHIGAAYPAVLLADTTANKLHTVVGVWNGAQITLFQNGSYVGSATASGTLNATNSNAFSINVAAGTRYPFNGQVFLASLSSKAIDQGLARDLSINPWQIFAPIPRRLFDAGAGTTHTTTGDVTGAGATVTGSATHLTLHTTSGTAQGGGATVTGAALHPHTSSGAVTGGGATVAGAADVTTGGTSHSSSGATEGGGAAVAGAATHLTLHTTSGATGGGGAAVAGASGHLTLHETSGAVQGGGGTTTGTAELTSLNGGKSSYLRQWLMEYYEAEWAQKDPVLIDPPAVAPTPVAQAARTITRRTVRAAVAEQKKPSPAPYRADPRAAVNDFIQKQTAAVARKARAAATTDSQDLAALTRRQQRRSAEAEEAEDEEILLLAAVL